MQAPSGKQGCASQGCRRCSMWHCACPAAPPRPAERPRPAAGACRSAAVATGRGPGLHGEHSELRQQRQVRSSARIAVPQRDRSVKEVQCPQGWAGIGAGPALLLLRRPAGIGLVQYVLRQLPDVIVAQPRPKRALRVGGRGGQGGG